jgi:hypothetical protein
MGAVDGKQRSGWMTKIEVFCAKWVCRCMVLGSALGAQEENGVLVLDVYSVNVPSDVIHEKGFALWAKALKGGEQSSHEYVPVIHAVYRLGGAVYIDKRYSSAGRLPTTERRR